MTSVRTARPPVPLVALAVVGFAIWVGLSAGFGQSRGGRTPSPPGAAVYFIDLKNGDTIPPTTVIHFGLRGMGVAPAGADHANSGHHHLLIDSEPPPLDQPIPNDFNHLHFGSGQTEAEVTLPPGDHVLQLLLGDHDHVPHSPPVMSEPIRVHVVEAGAGLTVGRHPSPPDARVYFVYPSDGDVVSRTPVIRFGLENMGVAPAGVDKLNTGHHHLLIDARLPPMDQPIPDDFNHLHFGAGQTQAKITLPVGTHTLQLLLGDENHMPHVPPVYSNPVTVTVTASGHREHRLHPHRGRPMTVRNDGDDDGDSSDRRNDTADRKSDSSDRKPMPSPFFSRRCRDESEGRPLFSAPSRCQ